MPGDDATPIRNAIRSEPLGVTRPRCRVAGVSHRDSESYATGNFQCIFLRGEYILIKRTSSAYFEGARSSFRSEEKWFESFNKASIN